MTCEGHEEMEKAAVVGGEWLLEQTVLQKRSAQSRETRCIG